MTRAVIADVEQHETLQHERARRGIDRWDELWEGVLHMVPPPSGHHQRLGTDLAGELRLLVRSLGLLISYETGVWRTDDDYRIPDVSVYPRERMSGRGIDGPPAVAIEIRSRGDETDAKIGWYIDLGVPEVIVINRDTLRPTLHTARGVSDPPFRSEVLGVEFDAGGDQVLRLGLPTGTVEIRPA